MTRRREMKTGTSQRIERPLKYETKLADEVQRAFCQFFITPEERKMLVDALLAFSKATNTDIKGFTDIRQGIYVASAKANELRRRGNAEGAEARDKLRYVLYLIGYGYIRHNLPLPPEPKRKPARSAPLPFKLVTALPYRPHIMA